MTKHNDNIAYLSAEQSPYKIIGIKVGQGKAPAKTELGLPAEVDAYKMRFEFLDRDPGRVIFQQKNSDHRGQKNVQFQIPLTITAGAFVQCLRAIADQAEEYLEVKEREYGKPPDEAA